MLHAAAARCRPIFHLCRRAVLVGLFLLETELRIRAPIIRQDRGTYRCGMLTSFHLVGAEKVAPVPKCLLPPTLALILMQALDGTIAQTKPRSCSPRCTML